jgi:hypothetical protein
MHFVDVPPQELSLQEVEAILGKRAGSRQRWWAGPGLLTQAGCIA